MTRHLAAFLARSWAPPRTLPGSRRPRRGAAFCTRRPCSSTAACSRPAPGRADPAGAERLAGGGAGAQARLLEGADLDLAVARGAAYYGYVRRGQGVRIRGGTAKSYYVGIESAMPAVPGMEPPIEAMCIAPFGMEEGTRGGAAAPGGRSGGGRAGALPLFRLLGAPRRQVGTMLEHWRRGARGTGGDRGGPPGRGPKPRRGGSGAPAGGGHRGRNPAAGAVSRSGDERWKVELNVRGEA